MRRYLRRPRSSSPWGMRRKRLRSSGSSWTTWTPRISSKSGARRPLPVEQFGRPVRVLPAAVALGCTHHADPHTSELRVQDDRSVEGLRHEDLVYLVDRAAAAYDVSADIVPSIGGKQL